MQKVVTESGYRKISQVAIGRVPSTTICDRTHASELMVLNAFFALYLLILIETLSSTQYSSAYITDKVWSNGNGKGKRGI